ncbi:RmlC-like cupin domain-containing protein, partial [Pyronema omphalodes]
YWFSIDKENKILRYGKGYETTSLTLLEVDLKVDGSTPWADWMSEVKYLAVAPSKADDVVIDEMSPVVVHNNEVTLEDLETGSVTVVENLPPACQQLYANVTGDGIKLDDKDFPEFSKAIHHSVTTEGCIGWNKLKEKADASGHPFQAQYLRVTLGLNKGNSPGSPFVMEVWPPHHHSSIHSHSNVFAVIKVLHGQINSFYYAALDPTKEESQYYRQAEFQKNDVTWLSDRQLQTHQLMNMTDETSVTIQCYQYCDHDHTHYEYFDYIDEEEDSHATIKKFIPTSDWGFDEG